MCCVQSGLGRGGRTVRRRAGGAGAGIPPLDSPLHTPGTKPPGAVRFEGRSSTQSSVPLVGPQSASVPELSRAAGPWGPVCRCCEASRELPFVIFAEAVCPPPSPTTMALQPWGLCSGLRAVSVFDTGVGCGGGGCSKCTLSSCRPQRCSALSCFIFSPKLPVLLLLSPSTPVREHVPSPRLETFSPNCARPSRDHPFSSPPRASSSEEHVPGGVFPPLALSSVPGTATC